jgi:hypothetical protein
MARATHEVAAIFRRHGAHYRQHHCLLPHQHKLMRAIERCRSAALGGHVERCGHCRHQRISYNSCRNRHCPKCQNLARAQWLARRKAELLPVEYFQVVFTIPSQLNDLTWQNQKLVYHLLFQASAQALQSIACDPKHLGADVGFFSILHTWGQNLMFHPHIHSVVTGGGLSFDRKRWIFTKPGFFLSVRVLSERFRTLLLDALQEAFGELGFHGPISHLHNQRAFNRWLESLATIEWVVHCKPPFGGAEQVLEYLGRYTHRVAISNQRLLAFDGQQVTFQYKDYRSHGRHRSKQMTLDAEEFIRRFLFHCLLTGFQRIRHYGILASSQKRVMLPLARKLLGVALHPAAPTVAEIAHAIADVIAAITRPLLVCPVCRTGTMQIVEYLPATVYDTS